MHICAEASTLARARILRQRLQPEVVMVNAAMEDGERFAFLNEVSSASVKTAVFSRSMNTLSMQRAFQCGARAVIFFPEQSRPSR